MPTTMPKVHALRVNNMYIPYIARDTRRKVMLSLAQEKSRSLESANDAKTGEESLFGEIHTNHVFGTS